MGGITKSFPMNKTLLCLLTSVCAASAELTIPAMTAYSLPDPNVLRTKKADGSASWSGDQKMLWYGEIKSAGEVSVAVKLQSPKDKPVKFKMTVAGTTHEAAAKGTGEAELVDFGKFKIAKPGYSAFELTATGNGNQPVGPILALQLDGPATEGAHFNVEERRNAASVHMNFPDVGKEPVAAYYNEVTGVTDPIHTFYMACGFSRGYMGMQVNSPTERRIIFSVWDSGSGQNAQTRAEVPLENQTQLLGKGDGVVAEVFGHEGTGGHSHLVYNWKTGVPQKFTVTAKVDGTKTIYSGYYFHPDKNEWMLIASFSAPHDGKKLRGCHSFVEDFAGQTGHFQRKALFGPAWLQDNEGKWKEVVTASFTHDGTGKDARLDRFMGVENGKFFLSNGGFVEGYTKYGTNFTRPASKNPPTLKLPNP